MLVHLCSQFAQKYPNYNLDKKKCPSQQNYYLTLPKDANVHDILPT